jgi:hypothetical protein
LQIEIFGRIILVPNESRPDTGKTTENAGFCPWFYLTIPVVLAGYALFTEHDKE